MVTNVTNPFDIAKHINEKTPLDFDIKDYSPWMMNRIMSNRMDTIFFAEIMNKFYSLDKDIQYSFYYNAIPKAKRFGKYNSVPAINNIVELIMKKYSVNQQVAESYFNLLDDEAKEELKEKMREGGKK